MSLSSFSSLEQLFIDNLIGVDPNQKRLRYLKNQQTTNEQRPMLEVERKAQEARQSGENAKKNLPRLYSGPFAR